LGCAGYKGTDATIGYSSNIDRILRGYFLENLKSITL